MRKSELKDEFDQMTDWKRIFEKIWRETRWLISYGEINELALRNVSKKFVNNFFQIKDNTIQKKLTHILDKMCFGTVEVKITREL